MLPRILTSDMPESERRRWRIVPLDTHVDLPGFPAEANVETGHVVMLKPAAPVEPGKPVAYESTAFSFAPNSFAIVAARMLVLVIGLSLALSACAFKQQVQMFTAGDIANAEAVAAAGGDKTGAACWAALEPAVAPAPNPNAEGLATGAERSRLLQATLGGPCGGVAAPVLLSTLKSVPGLLLPLVHLPVPVP